MVHGVFAIDQRVGPRGAADRTPGSPTSTCARETIAARYVPGLGFAGRFIAANPVADTVRGRAA